MKNDSDALATMEPQALSQYVFLEKYAAAGEKNHFDVQQRVARALAIDTEQEARFLRTQMEGFVPGGRINASAGKNRVSTMINCFVQPIADSMNGMVNGMPGIMPALAQSSETMRRGGGVGYDWTDVRPISALVKGTGSKSSGPVSFARIADVMCDTVKSEGDRRGAQLGVLKVWHPDIEDYIDAKKTPDFVELGLTEVNAAALMRIVASNQNFGWAFRKAFARLSNFNISVGVTNKFMDAVIADENFDLVHEAAPTFEARQIVCDDGVERYVYRTVRARDLWTKMIRNAYETGDPGILFMDTINGDNNLWYCEVIKACNPCGEQMLPAYGCCCLGSPNLTRYVVHPFTSKARFDFERFMRTVTGGVELLDRVLDVTVWPLPEQAAEAKAKRRIGQGFFGLASAMAMLGIRYGSPESVAFAAEVQRTMRDTAYRASIELAKKLGPFPMFDADKYLKPGTFASRLPQDIQDDIRAFGIRNSHLLSIAPTGTIALGFGDNASSGIEPIFDLHAFRNVRTGNGEERQLWEGDDHALRVLKLVQGEDATSEYLVTAQELTVEDHLAVVGAVAPYVDSAISKTINIPRDYPFELFEDVYMRSWRLGLKGITAYRPNDMVGSVLVSADEKAAQDRLQQEATGTGDANDSMASVVDPDRRVQIKDVPNLLKKLLWPKRPDVEAEGSTTSVRHPAGNFAVVVNHFEVNGEQKPLEIFIAGNEQPRGLAAIAKSLSVDMRTGDAAFVAMKLDSLLNTKGDDAFEMRHPSTRQMVVMPSLTAGFAAIVKHRLVELDALDEMAETPMVDALFSRREPKTGPEGSIGWHVDINNPVTGDDFLLHTKELVLPDGTVRPYSVWLSGQYPRVLDGLMKTLSIDMRISDPAWVEMKLRKLTTFGELRGDFLARVPGEERQQTYPSTVAYVAQVLLARMRALKLVGVVEQADPAQQSLFAGNKLLAGTGEQCPDCHALSLHKVGGCKQCSSCGYVGSCG